MLGKKIRGVRHLYHFCQNKPTRIFMFLEGNNRIYDCLALVSDGVLFILNNEMQNIKSISSRTVRDMMSMHNYHYALAFSEGAIARRDDYCRIIKQIIALPDDFQTSISEFVKTNKKYLQPIFSKVGDDAYKFDWFRYFYMLCDNSKNFLLWASLAYIRGVNYHMIVEALRWNENYQQMAKNLKKGTITAYTNFQDFCGLLDEMTNLRRVKRVNDTINMFNTAQKKLLRDFIDSSKHYQIMSKFRRLSDIKQNNFIRKMSTVTDPAEIMKQMSFVADVHFSWSKKDLMEYLENNANLSYKVIVNRDNTVLVEVKDFDTIKRLAKNTNWCISKNKQYWNNYMSPMHIEKGTRQYVLFDFDKDEDDVKSIVGFTIDPKRGITASHDYVNNSILDNRVNMTQYFRTKFHTLVPSKENMGGIHSLLMSKGIDISSLIPDNKPEYLWNCESFLKYVEKCLGSGKEDAYDILTYHDDVLAILVENSRISRVFGASYSTKVPRDLWGKEHIIFANFNCEVDNPDRMFIAIIDYDDISKEAYCKTVLNINCDTVPMSFDELLIVYDLPYDIICRSDVLSDKVFSAFTNYDLNTLKILLNDSKSNALTYSDDYAFELVDAIKRTLLSFLSDEFLKVIYDSGHSINGLVGNEHMLNLVKHLLDVMQALPNDEVTEEEIQKLINREKFENTNRSECVALCYFLKMIYEHENANAKKAINNLLSQCYNVNEYLIKMSGATKPAKKKAKSVYVKMTDPFLY